MKLTKQEEQEIGEWVDCVLWIIGLILVGYILFHAHF